MLKYSLTFSIFLIVLFFVYFFLSVPYYSGDVKNHLSWAQSLISLGPLGFFERDFKPFIYPNYPPLSMWLFAGSLYLYQLVDSLTWFLNITVSFFPSTIVSIVKWENVQNAFLKLPSILPAFGIAILLGSLMKLIKQKNKFGNHILLGGIFLLNPATFYLAGIWGQIDFLPVMFLLSTIYLLFKSKIYLAAVMITLAVLSKPTVLVFGPVLAILLLKLYQGKKIIFASLLSLIIFYLFYFPFQGVSLSKPLELYITNLDVVARTSGENAINFWGLIFNFESVADSDQFLILSYQQWGFLLLLMLMAIPFYKYMRGPLNLEGTMKILYILSLASFLVLTRMHERYLAPAIVFGTFLIIAYNKYRLGFIFVSVLYLLNLYRGSFQPNIPLFNALVTSLTSLRILAVGLTVITFYQIYLYLKNE